MNKIYQGNKKHQVQRKLENYAVINTSNYVFTEESIMIQYRTEPVFWNTSMNGYDAVVPDKEFVNGEYKNISHLFVIDKDDVKREVFDTITIEVENDTLLTFRLFKDSGGVYLLYVCNDNPGTCKKSVIINSSNEDFEISSVIYDSIGVPVELPDGNQNLRKNRITPIRLHEINDGARTIGRSVVEHIITYDSNSYEMNNIPEIPCSPRSHILTKYAVGVEMSNSQKDDE